MLSKKQAENILIVLGNSLKKSKGYYYTLYGRKTYEGLIKTLVNVSYSKAKFEK